MNLIDGARQLIDLFSGWIASFSTWLVSTFGLPQLIAILVLSAVIMIVFRKELGIVVHE